MALPPGSHAPCSTTSVNSTCSQRVHDCLLFIVMRRGRGICATAAVWACCAWSAAPAGAAAAPVSGAHLASAQTVIDHAHLQLVSADGNTLVEQGSASGTLPGSVEVALTLGDRTATSSFTIHTKGGTISGRGKGTFTPGKAGYDSFGGSVVVVHGSGRFHGAHGEGSLYGTIYRVTDAMSVTVTGKLRH
jgi:hypothetical protein